MSPRSHSSSLAVETSRQASGLETRNGDEKEATLNSRDSWSFIISTSSWF